MKKNRISKAKNQTYHFKKRCDKRIGTQIDRKAIQRRIKEQNYDENFYFLNRQSNRVTRYRYKYQDKWYIIPYDKNTHKVITIFEDKFQDDPIDAVAVDNTNSVIEYADKDCKNLKSAKFKKSRLYKIIKWVLTLILLYFFFWLFCFFLGIFLLLD